MDDLDLYMSPRAENDLLKKGIGRFSWGLMLKSYCYLMVPRPRGIKRGYKKTNFEHETKIDIHGPLNLNHLTLASRWKYPALNLNPRGTWYAWMDEEWEQVFELLEFKREREGFLSIGRRQDKSG